ncbi:phosphotransferase [Candidatus Uhrbacteria bacterium]|nr:phosphotransferase [Candidatus Uhrbacteria bacterium]
MSKEIWVQAGGERKPATVVEERSTSRILRLMDGQYAKVVRGSCHVRENLDSDARCAHWLMRNRLSWKYLHRYRHPGLLRVGERVIDNRGDEGYLCDALVAYALHDPQHPARESIKSFLTCCARLSRACGVMHEAGFVHGDITPGNVCFRDHLPVLIDFETSVKIGQRLGVVESGDDDTSSICCTPSCCSPEHLTSEPALPASDVYCLALTMLSWITELFAVEGASPNQTSYESMRLCITGEYPHWEMVKLRFQEEVIVQIFQKALSLAPQNRFQTGHALADAFEECLSVLPDQVLYRTLHSESYHGNARALSERDTVLYSCAYKN